MHRLYIHIHMNDNTIMRMCRLYMNHAHMYKQVRMLLGREFQDCSAPGECLEERYNRTLLLRNVLVSRQASATGAKFHAINQKSATHNCPQPQNYAITLDTAAVPAIIQLIERSASSKRAPAKVALIPSTAVGSSGNIGCLHSFAERQHNTTHCAKIRYR